MCDYVEVVDLTANGNEMRHGPFCMSSLPPKKLVSSSHQLRVTFHSDYNNAERGFKAVYSSSPTGKPYQSFEIELVF